MCIRQTGSWPETGFWEVSVEDSVWIQWGSYTAVRRAPEERVTRRRSQVGFARCSVCDRQSFARTTPSNRTTNRGSGENRCNGSDATERSFSLVRFVEEIPRKVGLFRLFQEKRSRVSLQWRLRGGGCSHERTLLSLNSLLTGEKTGIFMNLGNDFWIYNRVNAAFVVGYGPGSDFLFCPRQGIFSCLSGNYNRLSGN